MKEIDWLKPLFRWLLLLLGVLLMLALFQHKLIYHLRTYPTGYQPWKTSSLELLRYQTTEGSQTAYYLPPENNSVQRVWVLFGGNAGLALDWLGLLAQVSSAEVGFLLIDYPGYGVCEGSASPETIRSSTREAFQAWQREFGFESQPSWATLGHSLGAAAALQFAEDHSVDRIVLLAPFTSLADMVRHLFGGWLVPLLRHPFENRKPLQMVLERNPTPVILIAHGDRDEVVPVEMGRELAALNPKQIEYLEVPDTGHNDILSKLWPRLQQEFAASL